MAVFRVEHSGHFTIMDNFHLRDKRLSLKAKGLLSQILSLPEDWTYTLSGLAQINAEGRDAIRSALAELERAGYVSRRQTTDRNGKFSSNDYIIRERPASGQPDQPLSAPPLPASPTAASPAAASPTADIPTQLNKDTTRREKEKKDLQRKDSVPFPSAPPPASGCAAARPPERKRSDAEKNRPAKQSEMDACREIIRENIGYGGYLRDHPQDAGQLDEMVELMVEAVCSGRKTLRVAGNIFPQAVVRSRLLKLEEEHIRFVFDCLRENTTQIRNMKQYLLAVLYNAPATIENHYAAQVNHDLSTGEAYRLPHPACTVGDSG